MNISQCVETEENIELWSKIEQLLDSLFIIKLILLCTEHYKNTGINTDQLLVTCM